MISLSQYLLGYKIFTVKEEDVGAVAEIFLKHGIGVKFKKNTFRADAIKSKKIEALLFECVEYSVSDLRGFGGFLYKNRKRYGVMIAALISVILFLVSSDRVWDVRIEGCDKSYAEEILADLDSVGFHIGSSWSDTDLSEVENEFLAKSTAVAWLNINRRGTVAYVTVLEKEVHGQEVKEGYSNVVAACDAVIEEISVVRGVACVKVGDSVKKGDLLISGVLPEEQGGGFCYAEGEIFGRVSESISVSVDEYKIKKTEKNSEIARLDIKIFGFSLNIFNLYRNSDSTCDIIDTEKSFSLFGKKLPLSILKSSAVYTASVESRLSEDEMVFEASRQTSDLLAQSLDGATLLKIKTDGGFSDGKYTMVSEYVCVRQIGRDLPFEVKTP